MDQEKIGKFISECRKKQNLTQASLAEKLNITDRAVSKWETGRALPDSSLMLDLCNILQITVNDLLSGEVVTMNDFDQKQEKMMLELVRQKQEADKRLLKMEIFLGVFAVLILFGLISIAALLQMQDWLRVVISSTGFVIFLSFIFVCVRIEQVAGYYECGQCGHRYVPSYWAVNLAMHMGRTRYLKCPHCGKKSWSKKVLSKE